MQLLLVPKGIASTGKESMSSARNDLAGPLQSQEK